MTPKNFGKMENKTIKKYEDLGWKITLKSWTDRHKNDYYIDVTATPPNGLKFYVCNLKDFSEDILLSRQSETNENTINK